MQRFLFLSLFFTLTVFNSNAQDSKALLKRANDLFKAEAYRQALDTYTDILMFDNVLEAKVNIAHCHRMVGEFKEAEYWYRIVMPQQNDRKLEFNLAQALQGQEKFEDAADFYESYSDIYPRSMEFANACRNVEQFYVNATKYKVENLPFNSPYIDFGPVLYADNQLVFTSSRSGSKKSAGSYYAEDEAFLDMYVTQAFVSTWSKPKKLGGNINSQYHDGPVAFGKYFQNAWITRNTEVRGKGVKEQTKKLNLKLINAQIQENGKWEVIEDYPYNSADYTIAHPTLSENGKLLYFSSNMPGGYGGADLYVSVKIDTTWSYPKNLGPDINTPEDEQFPYIHNDGTLYFASNGHPGIGGYDIFFSKPVKRKWSKPQNMGAPINSAQDDFTIVFDNKSGGGYFASNRKGGIGSDDIYRFRINGKINYPKSIAGVTSVEDAQYADVSNPNIIDGSNEVIQPYVNLGEETKPEKSKKQKKEKTGKDKSKKDKTVKPTKPDSKEKKPKPVKTKPEKQEKPKKEKTTKPQKPKKDNSKPSKNKADKTKNKVQQKDVVVTNNDPLKLQQVPENSLNAELNIGPVQFKGKSDIMTESVMDLIAPVILYARENPRAKIRIESFTDARGTTRSNLDLSKNRLANIAQIFYQNGIKQAQLELVARGETGIINDCIDGADCSVAKHRFNQRMIFTKKDRNTPKVKQDNVLPPPEDEEYIDFDKNVAEAGAKNKNDKKKKGKKDKTSKDPINISSKPKDHIPKPEVVPTTKIEGFTYSVEVGPYTDFSMEQKFILNSLNLKQTHITVSTSKKKVELNRLKDINDVEAVIAYLKSQGFRKVRANVYRNGKITNYSIKDIKARK